MADSDSGAAQSIFSRLTNWGTSSFPPLGLATLILPLHAQPIQKLPLAFAPILLGSAYVNLAGYKIDAAGLTAAWSGLYLLLSLRRGRKSANIVAGTLGLGGRMVGGVMGAAVKGAGNLLAKNGVGGMTSGQAQAMATARRNRWFSPRGAIRAGAMGVAAVNTAAGGWVYMTGDRKAEAELRKDLDRWGMEKQ